LPGLVRASRATISGVITQQPTSSRHFISLHSNTIYAPTAATTHFIYYQPSTASAAAATRRAVNFRCKRRVNLALSERATLDDTSARGYRIRRRTLLMAG